MSSAYQIRSALTSDVGAITPLIALSARRLSRGFYTDQQIESAISHVFGVDSQLIADGTYYVVEAGQDLIGCGGWSKRRTLFGGDQFKKSLPDPLLDPRVEAARIRAFFIHPAWARQGIGTALLRHCEAGAVRDGFKRVELGSTLPGVPMYAALGFESVEPIDLRLADGVLLPIVKMAKTL